MSIHKRFTIEIRKHDVDAYNRLDWAVPIIQLFHLQMLLGGTILWNHYGTVATPGSLAFSSSMLGRKRIQPDKPDFHASDDHIRDNFEAMALRAWEEVLGTKDLREYASTKDFSLIEAEISSHADVIVEKYLGNGDYLKYFSDSTRNGALFLRDAIIYLELSAAIKAGDTGRIEEILKWITVMFQAGATKNYGNELMRSDPSRQEKVKPIRKHICRLGSLLMRLHCGLRYAWSAETKQAILSSWLVNLSGTKNAWIPTDLYQEYNNLLTKIIYAAKGPNFAWEHLSSSISMNIRTFSEISKHTESQYEIPRNNTGHSSVSSEKSVASILNSLREYGISTKTQVPGYK
ncbi:hypothetical protein BGX26_010732 [Mortierella sp. AD094]|nr:hypothetical protein BGX26_010732 [Mortierella sp. AD094]